MLHSHCFRLVAFSHVQKHYKAIARRENPRVHITPTDSLWIFLPSCETKQIILECVQEKLIIIWIQENEKCVSLLYSIVTIVCFFEMDIHRAMTTCQACAQADSCNSAKSKWQWLVSQREQTAFHITIPASCDHPWFASVCRCAQLWQYPHCCCHRCPHTSDSIWFNQRRDVGWFTMFHCVSPRFQIPRKVRL